MKDIKIYDGSYLLGIISVPRDVDKSDVEDLYEELSEKEENVDLMEYEIFEKVAEELGGDFYRTYGEDEEERIYI